jgi:hypothetical protein
VRKLELGRKSNVRKEIGNRSGAENVQGILMRCVHYKFGKQILIVQAFAYGFIRYLFSFYVVGCL